MKKISFTVFLSIILAISTFAQRPIRFEVKVPQMNCEECEGLIENALWKRVDGIVEIDAKWRAKKVVIKYIEDRIDSANIKLRIAELGFDASDELADEAKMKLLPKCCQKVVKPVVTKPADPIPPAPKTTPQISPEAPKEGGVKPTVTKPAPAKPVTTKPGTAPTKATKPATAKPAATTTKKPKS